MPPRNNSTRLSNQKPVNIFYVWYAELCRRLNSSPAPVVKPAKPKCQTVLDFVADRLKVEEWNPVINALKYDTSLHVVTIKSKIGTNCQFLHDVDTEDKLRKMKRRYGTLWTAFIMKSLLKSVSTMVRNSDVLTCLEFDGLPMFSQYLEPLMKALKTNKTLKCLSLSRCSINDAGCKLVCSNVRFTPNIEVLNLSGCDLTAQSGEYIANLIKYQQINRYCESWHKSLRYGNPDVQVMRGIKRITLNGNLLFGDDGLSLVLNELEDDLWIKALDMQKCGISENISVQILKVIRASQSLEIVDFRLNDQLSVTTMDKILTILKQKHQGKKPEYQWCSTTCSLTCTDSASNYTKTVRSTVHKVQSAPLKLPSKISIPDKLIRRTQTVSNVQNKHQMCLDDMQKQVMELSCQLQEEIARRKETEKRNQELKRKLDQMESVTSFQAQRQHSLTSIMTAIDNYATKQNGTVPRQNGLSAANGYHKNGFALNGAAACTILEKLVSKDNVQDKESDDDSLLNYVQQERRNVGRNDVAAAADDDGANDMMTTSQTSLFKFMQNLNSNNFTTKYQQKSGKGLQ